jgi:hypothetical protein
MELTLKVGQGDVEIFHRHVGRVVAEQFHHPREAHTGAKHFCCIGVPQLMRDDVRWEVDAEAHLMQVIAQLPDERFLGVRAR